MKVPLNAATISTIIAFIVGYNLVNAWVAPETPTSVTASQTVPHIPGVSDQGMQALINNMDRQVKEDYPDMMENVRTSAARREEGQRQLRDAEERVRQSYEPDPAVEAAHQRVRDACDRLRDSGGYDNRC
jgi:hypothetical protein